jgi:hypothetical protein
VRTASGPRCAALYKAGALVTVTNAHAPRAGAQPAAVGCALALVRFDLDSLARAPRAAGVRAWPADAAGAAGDEAWVRALDVPADDDDADGGAARTRTLPNLVATTLAVSAPRGLACVLAGRQIVTLDLEDDDEAAADGDDGGGGGDETAAESDDELLHDAAEEAHAPQSAPRSTPRGGAACAAGAAGVCAQASGASPAASRPGGGGYRDAASDGDGEEAEDQDDEESDDDDAMHLT